MVPHTSEAATNTRRMLRARAEVALRLPRRDEAIGNEREPAERGPMPGSARPDGLPDEPRAADLGHGSDGEQHDGAGNVQGAKSTERG